MNAVPNCARTLAASWLVYCVGCGGSIDPGASEELVFPAASALHGEWRRDYITAGAVTYHTRLHFREDGTVWSNSSSMNSFTEPPLLTELEGRYTVSQRGVVGIDWSADGSIDDEDSLVVAEGRALSNGSHWSPGPKERWWTLRGYLAQNVERSHFRRDSLSSRRSPALVRTTTEIAFSTAPARLVPGAACSLDLRIEASLPGAGAPSAELSFTLGCAASRDASGLIVILIPGWDTIDGELLAEQPSAARQVWRQLLEEEPDFASLPPELSQALQTAFEPYLVLDPERPDVLLHHIDMNSLDLTGYQFMGPSAN
jgi:hypothetical protein